MGNAAKFGLLMWKNLLLKKRKPWTTVLEVVIPIALFAIVIIIREEVPAKFIDEPTEWSEFSPAGWPFGKWLNMSDPPLPAAVVYAPKNNVTSRLMAKIRIGLGLNQTDLSFDTEDEMIKFLGETGEEDIILAGVVFKSVLEADGKTLKHNLDYALRFPAKPRIKGGPADIEQWRTDVTFGNAQRAEPGPRDANATTGGSPGYYREGFLMLQYAINDALLEEATGTNLSSSNIDVFLKRNPYPKYKDDPFVRVLQLNMTLFYTLAYIFIAIQIARSVVLEKERKLKESMKMMGLPGWLHWAAWFLNEFILVLIITGFITLLLCAKVSGAGAIDYTDPSIVFVLLLLYGVSVIWFCFMISTFFSKANTAAAAGGVVFFLIYVPYFFIDQQYGNMNRVTKMLSCLDINIAISMGSRVIGLYEGIGQGIHWDTVGSPVSSDDDFSMLDVWIMLIFDIVFYTLVMWYVEAVRPGDYGVPQRWYFPLTSSYWCGRSSPGDDEEGVINDSGFFERDPSGITAGIQIRKLKKDFGGKTAVDGISMNMYEGQITALLGHNGAGKTTTMNMLTGMIPPTSGTALVSGFDIRNNIADVRDSLGLCPQHDVLFDLLTVKEHLVFFAKLKNMRGSEVDKQVETLLEELNLVEKTNFLSANLSGGQKRKLSIAIALIGHAKVVILDEPTSGLDPSARRQIWDVLQKNKAGRTMLLTTHFMDEADILGDRIAIMSAGEIKCAGTPLFLKNKYGAGYHLVIVKKTNCDVPALTHFIQQHVPAAQLESNVSAELSFILPTESSGQFEKLFTELEEGKDELGISGYGASVTTMEEVFIKVGADEEAARALEKSKLESGVGREGSPMSSAKQTNFNTFVEPMQEMNVNGSLTLDVERNQGLALLRQQFWGLFLKRVLHTSRNLPLAISQLLVPVVFTVLGIAVSKIIPGVGDAPSLTLGLSPFEAPKAAFAVGNQSTAISANFASAYQFAAKLDATPVNVSGTTKYSNVMDYYIAEANKGIRSYVQEQIIGMDVEDQAGRIKVVSWFDNEALHTPPISLAYTFNAALKFLNANHTITTESHPQPKTLDEEVKSNSGAQSLGFIITIDILQGMAFLAASFSLFLIKERASKAKLMQELTGVHPLIFWMSAFLWDLINFVIPCALLLVLFFAFDVEEYTGERAGYVFLLLVLFGCAMLPFTYVMQLPYTVPSTGLVWLTVINIMSGLATVLTVNILQLFDNLEDAAKLLSWVFAIIFPPFNLGQGLINIYSNYNYIQIYEKLCKANPLIPCKSSGVLPIMGGQQKFFENYFEFEAPGIGRPVFFLVLQSVTFIALLVFIESGLLERISYSCRNEEVHPEPEEERRGYANPMMRQESVMSTTSIHEDDDVVDERQRVKNARLRLDSDNPLLICELSKWYGGFQAVKSVSVGVGKGECFGLLGVNGAGKTTSFKMLTGDVRISSGTAFVDGYDIRSQMKQVQRRLGYCPQFDALVDQMTGRETLVLFSRLRGVREEDIKHSVNTLISLLGLQQHADKFAGKYSGGNKRKLSAAIALVGGPSVVLLDEPTTGMDPVARRMLWDTLDRARAAGRTLVLTSHSMEECEALCTRLGIMVNGQFRCFGPTQHLKNKFGSGYTLIARVAPGADGTSDPAQLMTFVQEQFPGAELKDMHQGQVHYQLDSSSLSWGQVFGIIERNKERLAIEDYSVSQTTLEQVFIQFARSQVPPRETRPKRCFGGCCSGGKED